jgi:NDP-sugar pyrophosphorylase family protein
MNLGIIAAGDGQRLKDEGIEEPKPLIKIRGITLLERALNVCEKYKFDSCSLIINENFRKDVLSSGILNNYRNTKINCIFKSTPSSLHSLNELKSNLSGDSFCLMTIDSIYRESEFGEFIKSAENDSQYDGLIAVTDFVDDEKPLWTGIDADYKITGFGDEFKSSGFVTGGIYFFRKGIIEHTDTALANNKVRLRNFLQYLIETGIKLKAVPFSKIIDVDHAGDIAAAENFLQENRK